MIDLHCHLLPGIDDGPPDFGAALALARMQLDAGVHTVVATPHVHPDIPNDAAGIARAVEELRFALERAELPLRVVPGAEVDLVKAVELPEDELRALALGGGEWLLVEAPLYAMPFAREAIERVLGRGFHVVLAHPERSPSLQRDIPALSFLASLGVRMQLTASSLTGQFGRDVQRYSHELAAAGLVHVVSSDAHDTIRRPPGLLPAIDQAGWSDAASFLTELIPGAILDGEQIPAVPILPQPRRGLGGLLSRRAR